LACSQIADAGLDGDEIIYTDLHPDKHVGNTLAALREWAAARKND
jgi:hypothetical protein